MGRGPIPKGKYTISAVTHVDSSGPQGPYTIVLTPDKENDMHGRSGFLIHGDSKERPGTASHGCIVPQGGRKKREEIWGLPCKTLTVV